MIAEDNWLAAVTNDFDQVWHGSCRKEDDWFSKVETCQLSKQ